MCVCVTGERTHREHLVPCGKSRSECVCVVVVIIIINASTAAVCVCVCVCMLCAGLCGAFVYLWEFSCISFLPPREVHLWVRLPGWKLRAYAIVREACVSMNVDTSCARVYVCVCTHWYVHLRSRQPRLGELADLLGSHHGGSGAPPTTPERRKGGGRGASALLHAGAGDPHGALAKSEQWNLPHDVE